MLYLRTWVLPFVQSDRIPSLRRYWGDHCATVGVSSLLPLCRYIFFLSLVHEGQVLGVLFLSPSLLACASYVAFRFKCWEEGVRVGKVVFLRPLGMTCDVLQGGKL